MEDSMKLQSGGLRILQVFKHPMPPLFNNKSNTPFPRSGNLNKEKVRKQKR
jgi:hypothetical protein